MKKTTAEIPPQVAAEYAKASTAQAASEADGNGYTTTKPMKKAAASKGQFGLPKSVQTGKKR